MYILLSASPLLGNFSLHSSTTKYLWVSLSSLVGVQRRTFDEMVKIMEDTVNTKQRRGCPNKLDLEDQVLICLQYWREYRTYFHIAQDLQVSESTVCRTVQRKRKRVG